MERERGREETGLTRERERRNLRRWRPKKDQTKQFSIFTFVDARRDRRLRQNVLFLHLGQRDRRRGRRREHKRRGRRGSDVEKGASLGLLGELLQLEQGAAAFRGLRLRFLLARHLLGGRGCHSHRRRRGMSGFGEVG